MRALALAGGVEDADFVYSVVPEMALPGNWILTPAKTQMFSDVEDSHEALLENAAKALEKAAGK